MNDLEKIGTFFLIVGIIVITDVVLFTGLSAKRLVLWIRKKK